MWVKKILCMGNNIKKIWKCAGKKNIMWVTNILCVGNNIKNNFCIRG